MENKITSTEIKHALMCYFRFKRQWICASECLNNDVMVITNIDNIEVEIKISKYDLWAGEARKTAKHNLMLDPNDNYRKWLKPYIPNRFYICVPKKLKKEAIKWVETINKKYGIIIYNPELDYEHSISVLKFAKTIKKEVCKELKKAIMMRVCSENIGLIGKLLMSKE